MPFDDEETLQNKLSELRFSIDRRTGAIVATAAGQRESRPPLKPMSASSYQMSFMDSKRPFSMEAGKGGERDEALESLLGSDAGGRGRGGLPRGLSETSNSAFSSSQAAFEAASGHGYPPVRSP